MSSTVTKRQWIKKINAQNDYQIFHPETESSVVKITGSNPVTTLDDWMSTMTANRTFTLTGDVTGTVTHDGKSNVSLATEIQYDSHSQSGSTIDMSTANKAVVTANDKTLTVSDVSSTELGYLKDATGSIQTQLNGKSASTHDHDTVYVKQTVIGANNGVAPLNSSGKIDSQYLPSFVDDVIEGYRHDSTHFYEEHVIDGYLSSGTFYIDAEHTTPITPEAGCIYMDLTTGQGNATYKWEDDAYVSATPTLIVAESGKIYTDCATNLTYRWSGTAYVQTGGGGVALGETSETSYRGDRGAVAYNHSQSTHARTDATAVAASDTNGYVKINNVDTLVYQHPTDAGNKHIPSGGSSGNILRYSAAGTATWDNETALSLGTTTGNGNAVTDIGVSGHVITMTKGLTFLTEHQSLNHTITVGSGNNASGTAISATSESSANPSVVLGDSGVTAGDYGDTANQTPANTGTFKVPSLSVNAKGIVTAAGEHTVAMPASIPFAYSTTAAGTQTKAATCVGYTLVSNTWLLVRIGNANTYNGVIKLNVNSTGAKNIYINGTVTSSTNKTLPAGTYLVFYSGSYYYFNTFFNNTAAAGHPSMVWGGTTAPTGQEVGGLWLEEITT